MSTETLQKKIEERALKSLTNDYHAFTEFMQTNEFAKRLEFKKDTKNVPFVGLCTKEPLFDIVFANKNPDIDRYTNFNIVKEELLKKYIKEETDELFRKIDSLSDYFERE